MNDIYDTSDDNSSFLPGTADQSGSIDLGSIFSKEFANITPLYESRNGATRLFTATRYGKQFVLKALKEEYAGDPMFNLALAKEFEIGISLEHPAIRRTVGLEEIDGIGRAIVLEYIDGRSLEAMLKEGSIPMEQGRAIARDLANGLAYIHSKQILHRDFKPANILITHRGDSVRIIDFNLSDSDNFIVLKNPAGSGKYMAPELMTPGVATTPESDIYSLGVTVGEIADSSADLQLKAAARICMAEDPAHRHLGLSMLHEGRFPLTPVSALDKVLASSWLSFFLIALCAALAAFIANHYITQ